MFIPVANRNVPKGTSLLLANQATAAVGLIAWNSHLHRQQILAQLCLQQRISSTSLPELTA